MTRAKIERLDTALHEAGHAVMHVFLGLDNCDDVHINPGEGTLGTFSSRKMAFHWTDEPGEHGRRARIECRKYLLVVWAGPEAALREPVLRGTDKTLAAMVAKTISPRRQKKLVNCYQLRARGIIKRRLADAIQKFAWMLLDQNRIEGLKAENIICGLLGIEVGARLATGAARSAGSTSPAHPARCMKKADPKALTLKELSREMFKNLHGFFEKMERAQQLVEDERYIGTKEAAEFLNMSVGTLKIRMTERDGPPRYTDGGKLSFLKSELRAWRRQWRAGDQTGLP